MSEILLLKTEKPLYFHHGKRDQDFSDLCFQLFLWYYFNTLVLYVSSYVLGVFLEAD